jgi:NAD(P)-dependent dehydrogenase (short-subunit alcohol dehydrogenase family)
MSTILVTGASGRYRREVARLQRRRAVFQSPFIFCQIDQPLNRYERDRSGRSRALAIQADLGREQDVVRLFDTAARRLGADRGPGQ